MDKSELKEVKRLANELKPQFNIGKNGITDTLIDTIDDYLDARRIVKIKTLGAANKTEVKEFATKIANATDSEIIKIIGFTFVLFRE